MATFADATAPDIVDGPLPATCDHLSGDTFPVGATTVTCSATDAHGNTGSATFTVTVTDTTAPVVTPPADVTVEATEPGGCGGDVRGRDRGSTSSTVRSPASCDHSSGDTFAVGATTVTCSATDAHGNTGSASFTVTVTDTTAPVVTPPADVTVEATSPCGCGGDVRGRDRADIVDGPLPATCDHGSGDTFAVGDTTVTCSATDAHGNTGSGFFTVTVTDTTAPVVTPPADVVVEATGPSGAVATFADATAADIVDGPLPATCDHASGDGFAIGETTVICSATDGHGNTGSASFTVTVTDTTAPVVTPPADVVVEATSAAGAVATFADSTALDIVDGPLPATCDHLSGDTFAVGVTTVTCSATDAHGNTGSASFTVTVTDTTAPVVTPPADVTIEATSGAGAVVTFADATAADIVDGPLPTSCDHASGDTFPVGVTTVTCNATDAHGNTGSASFTVTVTDTTAPVVTPPADVTVEATGPSGAVATFADATAADIVDGPLPASCDHSSGDTFPVGVTTVTCNATDAHGNTGSASFTVTVTDTTAPAVTPPADVTVEATSGAGAVVTFADATAADIVDGPLAATCDHASGDTFPVGDTTVNCSATDAHGNTGTASFTATVTDTTAPVVTPPAT